MAQRWNSVPQRKRGPLKQSVALVRVQAINELKKKHPDIWSFLDRRGELKAGGITLEEITKINNGGVKEALEFYQTRNVKLFREMASDLLLNGPDRGFTKDELKYLIDSVQNKNQVGLLTDLMFGDQKFARENARRVIDSRTGGWPKDGDPVGVSRTAGQLSADIAEERKRLGLLGSSIAQSNTPQSGKSAIVRAEIDNRQKPNKRGVIAAPSEETMQRVKQAKTRLESRNVGPESFLTDQDIRDLSLVKTYDEPFYRKVRHSYNYKYNKFSDLLGDYSDEIYKIADSKFPKGSEEWKEFVGKYNWERGHLIPKSTQPHMRDVNSNISGESAARNRNSKAVTTFGDMVNFMERGKSDLPVIRPTEWQEINQLAKSLDAEGYNTRKLRSIIEDLSLYPMFQPVINKRSEIGSLPIISGTGNPRSFSDMYDDRNGVLSKNKAVAAQEYERLRRLAITMMAENPEWDLEGMLATRDIPNEFLNGKVVDPNLGRKVSLDEIVARNSNVGEGMFRTRAGAAEALNRGGGKLASALNLLALSGAVFAQDEDPMDESTWSEATMNRVMSALEAIGKYEQQGMQVIGQIPGAQQVGQAYNQGIGFLNWGKGQQTSAPVVYDESGQPTGGGSWNATKGAGDYIDFARQWVMPVEDAAIVVGAAAPRKGVIQSWFSPTFDEDTVSP